MTPSFNELTNRKKRDWTRKVLCCCTLWLLLWGHFCLFKDKYNGFTNAIGVNVSKVHFKSLSCQTDQPVICARLLDGHDADVDEAAGEDVDHGHEPRQHAVRVPRALERPL